MGFGGLGLGSMKSMLQHRPGANDAAKGGQEAAQIASKPAPAKAIFPGALPFQVPATPPQAVPGVAPVVAGIQKIPASAPPAAEVPAAPAPPSAAPAAAVSAPLPATPAAAAGAAPAPADERKKLEKDILDLFRQEENAATPMANMTSSLPDVDISALYEECLEMKGKLTGCQPGAARISSKKLTT